MATPRDLDPKFKDEPTVTPEETPEEKTEESQIVFRQPIVGPDGVATEKLHGPMPVSEWASYEKENKL